MNPVPTSHHMHDVYDGEQQLPDGRIVPEPIPVLVTANGYNGSVYVVGPNFEIILENRDGTAALVIWNRRDDGGDPDMVFFLNGNGSENNYHEVKQQPHTCEIPLETDEPIESSLN